MKKITGLIVFFILSTGYLAFPQNIRKGFSDGEVYVKIKNEVALNLDTIHPLVQMSSKLPFLMPMKNKYAISAVEASFYFSRSDILRRTFRISFSNFKMVNLFMAELRTLKEIEYVEQVPLMQPSYMPNDLQVNQYSGQYALYNIHAREAWDVTQGNNQVVIAIVDNAVDVGHVDLSNNVDRGWDVSDNDNNPRPPSSNASWNHGTHTSGIACASSDNNIGIASLSFHCVLMGIKATRDASTNNLIDHGYEGISWAVAHGARVVSCSWGNGSFSQTGQNIINDAFSRNVIVVASAGNNNNNTIQYPAGYNHVFSVAAVDISDTRANFSSYGNWVDVAAPGVNILSTLPGNGYGQLSGTSMAAPLVAGLCGLLISLDPFLSNDEVVSRIINNADNIDAQNPGFAGLLGSGRINAYRAVESTIRCTPSMNLGPAYYSVLKTESSGYITAESKIAPNTQVTFDASDYVILSPGFTANNGSLFYAYIDGCGNRISSNNKVMHKDNTVRVVESNSINNQFENYKALASAKNQLTIFPNPANISIYVSLQADNDANISLNLYDLNGKSVYRKQVYKNKAGVFGTTINTANLPPGVYLLQYKNDGNLKTAKVVIVH